MTLWIQETHCIRSPCCDMFPSSPSNALGESEDVQVNAQAEDEGAHICACRKMCMHSTLPFSSMLLSASGAALSEGADAQVVAQAEDEGKHACKICMHNASPSLCCDMSPASQRNALGENDDAQVIAQAKDEGMCKMCMYNAPFSSSSDTFLSSSHIVSGESVDAQEKAQAEDKGGRTSKMCMYNALPSSSRLLSASNKTLGESVDAQEPDSSLVGELNEGVNTCKTCMHNAMPPLYGDTLPSTPNEAQVLEQSAENEEMLNLNVQFGTVDPRIKTPVDICGNELSSCPHTRQWHECIICWCAVHDSWRVGCAVCDIESGRVAEIRAENRVMSPDGGEAKVECRGSTVESVFDVSDSPVRFDRSVVVQAKRDWWQIRKNIKYARCRRSVPQHALPNEVWRMVLLLLRKREHDEYKGIGYERGATSPIRFCNMAFKCLCLIRHTNVAPMQWHCSKSFSLPKKHPAEVKVAYDCQRAVHSLDPVGKAYYKGLLNNASIPQPLMFEYAYLKGRRRESAIKQQLITGWRLRSNKISHDMTSYDMTNAFASLLFEVIDNVMQFIVEPGDWLLMRQRYHQASTCVPTHEGESYYQIGSGALPGDKIGADFSE